MINPSAISVSGLILSLCALAYLTDSQIDDSLWSSINSLGFLEGVLFALGFGLGVPVWLSVIVVGLILFILQSKSRKTNAPHLNQKWGVN